MANVQCSKYMPCPPEYSSCWTNRFKDSRQLGQGYRALYLSYNKPRRRKVIPRVRSLPDTRSAISTTLSPISTSQTMGNLPSLDQLGVDVSCHDPKLTPEYTHPILHSEYNKGDTTIEMEETEAEKGKYIERSMTPNLKCKELYFSTMIDTSTFTEWQTSPETTVEIFSQHNKQEGFNRNKTSIELEEEDQQNINHDDNSKKLIENNAKTRHETITSSTITSTQTDPPCKHNIQAESIENNIPYTDEDLDYLNSIQESPPTDDEAVETLTPTLDPDVYCVSQANGTDTSVLDDKTIQSIDIDSGSTELDKFLETDFFSENMLNEKQTLDTLFDEAFTTDSDVSNTDAELDNDNIDVFPSNAKDSVDFKANLIETVQKSIESNSITPIIKQELQYKIQFTRLERGEEELTIASESPRVYKLTDAEIRKKYNRREQNRLSALRSRSKMKKHELHLERKVNDLEMKNSALMVERNTLLQSKTNILKQLKGHLPKCPKSFLAIKQLGVLLKMYAS